MASRRYGNTTSFIDMLFLALLGFVFLFVIAFMLMNPPDPSKVDPKVEMMIIMTWPIEYTHDIDLWLKLPDGGHVGYQQFEYGLTHLDRDDRGNYNDQLRTMQGELVTNPVNQEVISLRGLAPGTYIVNVHFYAAFIKTGEDMDVELDDDNAAMKYTGEPIPVQVELIDLNPKYSVEAKAGATLKQIGDEGTVFQFTITDEKLTDVAYDKEDLFVTRERFGGVRHSSAPLTGPSTYDFDFIP